MKKLILLVIILLIAFENIFLENIGEKLHYLFTVKSIYVTGYYVFVSLMGFLSVALFLFIKEKFYYGVMLFLLLLSYAIGLIYKEINGIGFTLNDLSIALTEGEHFALDALLTYAGAIQKAGLLLLFLFLIIFFIRKVILAKQYLIEFKYLLILFLVSLGLAYSITFRTIGETQTRPTLIKTVNIGIYYMANRLYYGKRESLGVKPTAKASYKNIILIVDESIGGKYLSVNGYERETTPYLKSIYERFINLGLASSGANCSAVSNLILMSGIQLNQLPDTKQRSLKKASIFQYAKNAGYKTHYISGQGVKDSLQNHMTSYDLEAIDNYRQLDAPYHNKSMPEEDIILNTKEALKSSQKNFIFIVKHGAHFQWEQSYPEEEKLFTPTLKRTDALTLSLKEEALNSYLNAIRYNVDLFFKAFLKHIEFFNREDTLIIYTSDHGQSILEAGRTATHCDSTNPPLSQGIVPLLLFTNANDKTLNDFEFKANSYTHYQIFPTIEKFMGYEELNAKTLFDEVEKQVFVSGDLFGRVSLQRNALEIK